MNFPCEKKLVKYIVVFKSICIILDQKNNLGKRDLSGLVKKLEAEVSKCRKMRASLESDANLAALKDGLQSAENNLSANLDDYQETLAAKQDENEAKSQLCRPRLKRPTAFSMPFRVL